MSAFDPSCVDVHDFFECLEIRNVKDATEEEVVFSCPFPGHSGGDEKPSAYMNKETTAFFCHSCHEKGDAVGFTCKILGISPIQAIRFLKQRYAPGFIDPDARSMQSEVKKLIENADEVTVCHGPIDESHLDPFAVDWDAVEKAPQDELPPALAYPIYQRGFLATTLNLWEFGYDSFTDRLVFPVRDDEGRLLGFKGRTWDKERQPKYLVIGDRPNRGARYGFPCYQVSQVVFGLHRTAFHTHLIVVEGELNAVALDQLGYDNAVAINGSNISDTHARLLRKHADSVTVFFDSDESGRRATWTLVEKLSPHMPVKIVPEHDGDPADMPEDEIEACLEQARGSTELALPV